MSDVGLSPGEPVPGAGAGHSKPPPAAAAAPGLPSSSGTALHKYTVCAPLACTLARGAFPAEVSVHRLPRAMQADLPAVVPSLTQSDAKRARVVFTAQNTGVDLTDWGPVADARKDLAAEAFLAWAEQLRTALSAQGAWATYIDPPSGMAVHGGCGAVWPEVDAATVLLGWPQSSAGGCKLALHPRWGAKAYPATVLTTAPEGMLLSAVHALCSGDAEQRQVAADTTTSTASS